MYASCDGIVVMCCQPQFSMVSFVGKINESLLQRDCLFKCLHIVIKLWQYAASPMPPLYEKHLASDEVSLHKPLTEVP